MSTSYQHLTDEELKALYTTHRQNLAELERQKAGFGSLHVPLPVTNQLRHEQIAITAIHEELERRRTSGLKPLAYRYRPDADPTSLEARHDLLYISHILDASLPDLESILGQPFEITINRIGNFYALPNGSETRAYRFDGMRIDIAFDKQGIAQGISVEGLAGKNHPLDDWHTLLHRLGISMQMRPDRRAEMSLWWNDYQGHAITVAASKIGGSIDIVRVYKVPKP